ncbi:MAG TPA: diguanylate cyclase [Polyangiales bacterium]
MFAERLRRLVEAEPGTPSCTVSVGVATLDERMTTDEDLIRQADESSYEAERSGRNRVGGCARPGDSCKGGAQA